MGCQLSKHMKQCCDEVVCPTSARRLSEAPAKSPRHEEHIPEPSDLKAAPASLDAGVDLVTPTHFIPNYGLNSGLCFETGKQYMLQCFKETWANPSFENFKEACDAMKAGVLDFIRGFQPVHRVSEAVFSKVLADCGLRSRAMLQALRETSPLDAAVSRLKSNAKFGFMMGQLKVTAGKQKESFTNAAKMMLELRLAELDPEKKDQQDPETGATKQAELDDALAELRKNYGASAIKDLEALVADVAQLQLEAKDFDQGVHYPKDKDLGTNEHVFAIIGNNMCTAYGEVVILLNNTVMHQPDFNMTNTAATSYLSGRTYFHRPWASRRTVPFDPAKETVCVDDDAATPPAHAADAGRASSPEVERVMSGQDVDFPVDERIELFNRWKLNPCVIDWEVCLAFDLIMACLLFFTSKRDLDQQVDKWTKDYRDGLARKLGRPIEVKDVTLKVFKEWYSKINSHGCIEGHMPAFVPLDYIDQIVMPKQLYGKLQHKLMSTTLSDGQNLIEAGKVTFLPDDDYATEVRRWQAEYFDTDAVQRQSKYGFGGPIGKPALSFGLVSQKRKEIFLPGRVLNPKKGFQLRMTVKGQHIRITLSNQQELSFGKKEADGYHCYLFVIGVSQNKRSYIKRGNHAQGDGPGKHELEKVVTREQDPDAMAWPDRFREYILTFDVEAGKLQLCTEQNGQRKELLMLTDPRPHQDIQYVGVSNFETPVDFQRWRLDDFGKDGRGDWTVVP